MPGFWPGARMFYHTAVQYRGVVGEDARGGRTTTWGAASVVVQPGDEADGTFRCQCVCLGPAVLAQAGGSALGHRWSLKMAVREVRVGDVFVPSNLPEGEALFHVDEERVGRRPGRAWYGSRLQAWMYVELVSGPSPLIGVVS